MHCAGKPTIYEVLIFSNWPSRLPGVEPFTSQFSIISRGSDDDLKESKESRFPEGFLKIFAPKPSLAARRLDPRGSSQGKLLRIGLVIQLLGQICGMNAFMPPGTRKLRHDGQGGN